jgi:dipeptide transport system ATP-binding protein
VSTPILTVKDLAKHYPIKKLFMPAQTVKALDGVSFSLEKRRTLAVVGESGCGKSTLAKVLMAIEKPTSGELEFAQRPSKDEAGARVQLTSPGEAGARIQMIFQDPYSSINPRKKAWQIISEPLRINTKLSSAECRARAIELMAQVGLRPEFADRYPHMFSGGQRQRIGIARALALRPEILICDEPISALDVSIQAQVINLLIQLQDQHELSYIFISHDLSVVRHLADEVLVMYLGKVVEHGSRDAVFSKPLHPYTQALLGSTPDIKRRKNSEKRVIPGEPPSPLNPPPGCAFHKRCPMATARCSQEVPTLREVQGRQVACHLV